MEEINQIIEELSDDMSDLMLDEIKNRFPTRRELAVEIQTEVVRRPSPDFAYLLALVAVGASYK
jgi:hypothetical protein